MKNFADQMEHREFHNVIEKAAWIHAEFVRIHPFQDGNGRTARLMMNYTLMENGLPPTIIKTEGKVAYFKALETYSTEGNLLPFQTLVEKNIHRELDEFLEVYRHHLESANDKMIR